MGGLNAEQVQCFDEEGYLVVDDVLDPEDDLDPIIVEYEGVLDRLADDLFEAGVISSRHEDLPFGKRLSQICAESGKVHAQYFDFSLPQSGIKKDTPFWAGPAVFNALRNDKILDVVESIIGPEIYSNPVQHVRIKPPEKIVPRDPVTGRPLLGATPWHQDNGVVNPEADETEMLTVWFPLLDAPVEAGPLEVSPRSHRRGLLPHCPAGSSKNVLGGLHIPEEYFERDEMVTLPMSRGKILLLTRRTVHGSLPNVSDDIRWSFDLRYNPIGQATGRGFFPGFVARSRSDPGSELRDPDEWRRMWTAARAELSERDDPTFNRWNVDDPACA